MPLSDHEQRMLDQIESALYAEDPKFASSVRTSGVRSIPNRRRLQAAALFLLGVVLLVGGMALPKPGGFPIVSIVGFLLMFGAGVLVLRGPGRAQLSVVGASPEAREGAGRAAPRKSTPGKSAGGKPTQGPSGGFASRMEERFRRRFDQR